MPTTLPPLDKLDPTQAWEPWQPKKGEWNTKWAAHLYRRAGFGASKTEIQLSVENGHEKTLDLLLNGQPIAKSLTPFLENEGIKIAKAYNPNQFAFNGEPQPNDLRAWWLYCMLFSGHPLREKMTLFWHNHFATSINKVKYAQPMVRQNHLLRKHALGKFGPFLLEMSQDPAMLNYLDSNSNIKGRPNENYAREVMELFSLGVGNYTEKDIQEAARAFTGWHTDGEKFTFNDKLHDEGEKTVLGQKGNWNGDDIVGILLKQPVAARFLVRKLYRDFISEAEVPSDSLIEPLADRFRKSDYDIALLMRTMLSCRLFYSQHAFRQRIKSPIEYVLGAAKSVARESIPPNRLVDTIDRMGQMLFAPPNVKGWPGSKAWLNTATLLVRQNFAHDVATGRLWGGGAFDEFAVPPPPEAPGAPAAPVPEEPPPEQNFDPARLIHEAKATTPEAIVKVLLDAFLPGDVAEAKEKELVAYTSAGNPTGAKLDRRARETARAIIAMPEYQLA
jgi:uncharacterized protein (DUF1800 family)